MPMTRDELIVSAEMIAKHRTASYFLDPPDAGEFIRQVLDSHEALRALLSERPTPPTCASCRWFQSTPAKPGQPASGSDICMKEPSEWPMHWRETWPSFGCNGWEPQS